MGSCDIVSNVREKVNSDQMLNPCSTKPRTFGATSSGGFLLTNSVKFIIFVLMVIWNAYLLLNWSRLQKNNRGCILVTGSCYLFTHVGNLFIYWTIRLNLLGHYLEFPIILFFGIKKSKGTYHSRVYCI